MLDPTPPPPARTLESQDTSGAPPPSSLRPPSKKRRVTVSGAPHPLNTNVKVPSSDQPNSTPISPVVIGFNIMRDDPAAMEQVRSMLTVKQKQKELIEQRRGSVAGIVSTGTGSGGNAPFEERSTAAKTPAISRSVRRSPNSGSLPSGNRRNVNAASGQGGSGSSNVHPPSPSPMIVPSQQLPQTQVPSQAPSTMMSNSLAPPPISFARRRAGLLGAKKKPADIVISPREAHTQEQFQPAIQSAPPIPQAGGQGQFYSGRSPMTLPRLPSMGSADSSRRFIAGQVPPTPTQFSVQRNSVNLALPPSIPGISRRSPSASIPISTTLVPPTPASLHHPGYSGDKSAFLAPFEVFYDALNDSKQLKNWLSEQLQKSNSLMQTLAQQQEKMSEIVNGLVEKKVCGMRDEIVCLHRRVEELEEALRSAKDAVPSVDVPAGSKTRGKQTSRNGILPGPVASETYTFPPVPSTKRPDARPDSSPSWRLDREAPTMPESENGSPAPYDVRRVSISAIRLDPPRVEPPSQRFAVQSPPQAAREVVGHPSMGKATTVPSSMPVSARSNVPLSDLGALHRRQPADPRIASFRYQLNPSASGGETKVGSPPSVDCRGNSAGSPRDHTNSSMGDG
jgi:hypothetical protein